MPLDQMGEDPSSLGTTVLLSDSDIPRWLSQTLEVQKEIQGAVQSPLSSIHEGPPMRPNQGFIEFVSFLCHLILSLFLSRHPMLFIL